jgi:hypothetical protein
MAVSTIFQLYLIMAVSFIGGLKLEYREKTTDLSQVTDKLTSDMSVIFSEYSISSTNKSYVF